MLGSCRLCLELGFLEFHIIDEDHYPWKLLQKYSKMVRLAPQSWTNWEDITSLIDHFDLWNGQWSVCFERLEKDGIFLHVRLDSKFIEFGADLSPILVSFGWIYSLIEVLLGIWQCCKDLKSATIKYETKCLQTNWLFDWYIF